MEREVISLGFTVDSELFAQFPELCFGLVVARNVNNEGESAVLRELLMAQVEATHRELAGSNVRHHPRIAAWREAFRKLDYNPNRFPPSIEALAKRIAKRAQFPSINKVVDLVNSLSLKYVLPMGAHDLDKIEGDMQVRFTNGGEVFTPFGGEERERVEAGEVVYTDDEEICTRRWVWRQGERSKVEPASKTILFPIDGFYGVSEEEVRAAREELAALLTEHTGAQVSTYWLDVDHPAVEFT
ncbi:MAG: hypothetical protein GX349_05035 [Firmicutes bacterium]|nr:hypothetical protein [Bacillota bacterium]